MEKLARTDDVLTSNRSPVPKKGMMFDEPTQIIRRSQFTRIAPQDARNGQGPSSVRKNQSSFPSIGILIGINCDLLGIGSL
jgi:hypothetical protein